MIQPKSDQDRFTAERVVRTRPKTYRAIVKLLADPDARIEHIAQRHRVSTHTARAIRAREAVAIAERKQRLMSGAFAVLEGCMRDEAQAENAVDNRPKNFLTGAETASFLQAARKGRHGVRNYTMALLA
jgi:hypothetical protein